MSILHLIIIKALLFVVSNGSQKGQLLNKIVLYSGKYSKQKMCSFDMIDVQDDLLTSDIKFFLEPNSSKKFRINATRFFHEITHGAGHLYKKKKVYIQLDFGKSFSRKFNTQITTEAFVEDARKLTDTFQEAKVYYYK